MNQQEQSSNPIFIAVRGMPGSGKSYIANELVKSLGPDKVVLLDPDATDYESEAYKAHVRAQIAEGVDPTLHAYRFLRAQAYDGIAEHKVVIWNQAFTNLEIFHKMIARLRDHAALHHVHLPILVVEVEIDPAVAKERILQRQRTGGHGASDTTLAQRLDNYKLVSFAGEGYETVTVHGEDDVSTSVATIMNALRKITNEG